MLTGWFKIAQGLNLEKNILKTNNEWCYWHKVKARFVKKNSWNVLLSKIQQSLSL